MKGEKKEESEINPIEKRQTAEKNQCNQKVDP